MAIPHVALLLGGPSSEHEVSKASALNILESVDARKVSLQPILITPQLEWRVYPSSLGLGADTPFEVYQQADALAKLPYVYDAAFIAMHGEFGEDGQIQRLLDRAGVPYQGSGPKASALVFDKARSNQLLRRIGLAIPDSLVMNRAEWVATRGRKMRQLITAMGEDLVVKPVSAGSSVGVILTNNGAQLADAIEQVSVEFDRFMVQRFVRGIEVTCAVLDTDAGLIPLPPTLIRPRHAKFFDYDSKYTPGESEEITPAPLKPVVTHAIQQIAVRAHRALGCRDYSRTDFILSQGRAWVLETNTLPGLTNNSLLPKAAIAAGWEFSELIYHLIDRALHRPEVIELH